MTVPHPVHAVRCTVLPPHMLEALARNGSPAQQEAALRTLSLDQGLRTVRRDAGPLLVQGTAPAAAHRNRLVHDAKHGTTLPGLLVRDEDGPATGDAAVDEAHTGLGATFDLFHEVYGRNSIDDAGMDLVASVHYGRKYNNAFFDGAQMVFGDGDGELFNRFTVAVDVMGHELAHGVTAATAALEYEGQSGALNESMSDVFGSLVKQRLLGQRADEADWLIGAGLLAEGVAGVALRSMAAPGTAYDDDLLGSDPQPAHMDDFVRTVDDNGGVHINSGIPNKAFHVLATGLGGYAWDVAGRIWYDTLRDARLTARADFATFAALTVTVARATQGPDAAQAVHEAWASVGVEQAAGDFTI